MGILDFIFGKPETSEIKKELTKEFLFDLIRRRQKINAIKMVREAVGIGLKEAKDFVEYLEETGCSWEMAERKFKSITEALKNKMSCEDSFPHDRANINQDELYGIKILISEGKKIEAIKKAREITGMGLKEAKDFVEGLNGYDFSGTTENIKNDIKEMLNPYDLNKIKGLIKENQKIEAIKKVREITGMGLKEAKDFVESL